MTDVSGVNSDTTVFFRLRKERTRLEKTQEEVARLCGVSKRTVMRWEKSIQIPANHLATLVSAGFDASYVLEGVRSGSDRKVTVTAEELDWLWSWRSMSEGSRSKAKLIIDALVTDDVHSDKSPRIRRRPGSIEPPKMKPIGGDNDKR